MSDGRYGSRVPSEREQRVIQLVAQGLKNREVADEIGTRTRGEKLSARDLRQAGTVEPGGAGPCRVAADSVAVGDAVATIEVGGAGGLARAGSCTPAGNAGEGARTTWRFAFFLLS